MSNDQFYRQFEQAFRGEREEIITRLEAYLDFVLPLAELSADRKAIDLGCGRGEWLELLGRHGFAAHGVDLDKGMLEDCVRLGLSAEYGDAIAYLKGLDDNSQAIVSGFHIAEHLPFAVLQELIQHAVRVLEPGGLLILETPNPENIRVGTMTFHMDPTHNKPLPPGLLSFLPRHYGFARAQVVRLQESHRLRAASTATLVDVFEGVSPDYAVVAQKGADSAVMARFDAAFAKDRGLTLETLSQRFQSQLALHADIERLRNDLRADFERLEDRLDAVYSSTSWRVTAPLRAVSGLAGKLRGAIGRGRAAIRRRLQSLVLGIVYMLHRRPALRRGVVRAIRLVPGLEGLFRKIADGGRRSAHGAARRHGSTQLTPRGRQIQDKLKRLQGSR